MAKKAAVAANLAAIGTALSELQPEQKRIEEGGVNDAERKGGTHRRAKASRHLAVATRQELRHSVIV